MYEDRTESDIATLVGYISEFRNTGISIRCLADVDEIKLMLASHRAQMEKHDAAIAELRERLAGTSDREHQDYFRANIRSHEASKQRCEILLEALRRNR